MCWTCVVAWLCSRTKENNKEARRSNAQYCGVCKGTTQQNENSTREESQTLGTWFKSIISQSQCHLNCLKLNCSLVIACIAFQSLTCDASSCRHLLRRAHWTLFRRSWFASLSTCCYNTSVVRIWWFSCWGILCWLIVCICLPHRHTLSSRRKCVNANTGFNDEVFAALHPQTVANYSALSWWIKLLFTENWIIP